MATGRDLVEQQVGDRARGRSARWRPLQQRQIDDADEKDRKREPAEQERRDAAADRDRGHRQARPARLVRIVKKRASIHSVAATSCWLA